MRILLLNHNTIGNGTYFRAYHFGRQLTARGHKVTLITTSKKNRIRGIFLFEDDIDIIQSPDLLQGRGRTGWDLWNTFWRIFYLRNRTFDIIHAFDSRPAVILPAIYSRRANGGKLILDWADWWGRGGTIEERTTNPILNNLVRPIETYFEESFREFADGTTVISSALKKRALDLGVPPESIIQIPGGSDIEGVTPQEKSVCRHDLALSTKQSLIGYLGILSRSDAQLLFNTYAKIKTVLPNCKLLLIGNHRATIKDKHGIIETDYVSKEQLVKYLGACDVMLLPLMDTIASRGRWPSKINDYLAVGRPVVASAVGDIKNLFDKFLIGKTTVDTPDSLAGAVCELLADNKLQDKLGREARRVAETELAWSILTEKLETFYDEII